MREQGFGAGEHALLRSGLRGERAYTLPLREEESPRGRRDDVECARGDIISPRPLADARRVFEPRINNWPKKIVNGISAARDPAWLDSRTHRG
jgi:hypothetical protein